MSILPWQKNQPVLTLFGDDSDSVSSLLSSERSSLTTMSGEVMLVMLVVLISWFSSWLLLDGGMTWECRMRAVSSLNMDGSAVLFSPGKPEVGTSHQLSALSSLTFLSCVVGQNWPRDGWTEVVVIECCDWGQLPRSHHGHGSHV